MEYEISCSTPKLSLYKLPSKPRDHHHHHHMLTPPLSTLASIPFEWEVAPGKPKRAATTTTTSTTTVITTPPPPPPNKNKAAAARRLGLPPRLLLHDEVTSSMSSSPTTVLDGPYEARSFSFRKGSSLSSVINGKRGSLSDGSWRWGSFKEEKIKDIVNNGGVDFSVVSGFDGFKNLKTTPNVKITRIRRRGSFLNNFFASNSNPLASIYESIKVAVPWGRRRQA